MLKTKRISPLSRLFSTIASNLFIIFAAIFCFTLISGIGIAVAGWVEPTCDPNGPGGPDACNTSAPISTANVAQSKEGNLLIGKAGTPTHTLVVDNGSGTAEICLNGEDAEDCISNFDFGGDSVFVGLSANYNAGVDGNVGGYKSANDLCVSAYSGSHICTASELISTYSLSDADSNKQMLITVKNLGAANPGYVNAWINHGPPGYVDKLANDCNGWQYNNYDVSAGIWSFGQDGNASYNKAMLQSCEFINPFACCK